ncbi:MAG: acylneuraminate cytidylyltransferase, partial [Ignavibacteria bacterium]|nr:acylneuraminate cytidylyltransferase [Ignavibacteria bacterium]
MDSDGSLNIVVVVQARTSSSRLPNKVMLPLAGEPLLVRMMERVMASKTPTKFVVATSTE